MMSAKRKRVLDSSYLETEGDIIDKLARDHELLLQLELDEEPEKEEEFDLNSVIDFYHKKLKRSGYA